MATAARETEVVDFMELKSVRMYRSNAAEASRQAKSPGREQPRRASIPVVIRLVRPFERHVEIGGLFRGESRQLHADLGEVQARHFLVQLLRENIDGGLVHVLVLP